MTNADAVRVDVNGHRHDPRAVRTQRADKPQHSCAEDVPTIIQGLKAIALRLVSDAVHNRQRITPPNRRRGGVCEEANARLGRLRTRGGPTRVARAAGAQHGNRSEKQ